MKLITIIAIFFFFSIVFSITNIRHTKTTKKSKGEKVKNIDYLAKGYDIFLGNPSPSGKVSFDPGFRTSSIFQFEYTQNLESSDGVYIRPDKIEVLAQQSCSLDMSSTTIKSATNYKSTLESSVTIEEGLISPVSFSGSVEFKQIKQGTTNEDKVYIQSVGECPVYRVSLSPWDLPKASSSFITYVKTLPAAYNQQTKSQYMRFIGDIGTHFFQEVIMGSRYGFLYTLTKNQYTSMVDRGLKVNIAAKFASTITIGGKTSNNVESQDGQEFSKENIEKKVICIGSTPPSDNELNTWASTISTNPMPINYKLRGIEGLFNSNFLPDVPNVNALHDNIKAAVNDYCEHLKSQGKISSCVADAVNTGTVPSSCRLCAGGCGGQFTNDGGAVSMDQTWPKFFMTYDNRCSGALKTNEYSMGQGVHLCCQQESSTVKGSCKLCTSCGGGYSHEGGALMCDQNWPNWVSAHGSQCSGDGRTRAHEGSGMHVCCQSDACALCNSCGGSYPEENGLMSYDQKWPNFFNIKGNGCSGSFSHQDYREGVTLCCKSRGI